MAYVVEGLFFIINLYQSVSICGNLYKSVDKKKTTSKLIEIVSCTPAGARTLDTLIKSQVLYQLSYKRITFEFCGCKGTAFFYNNQIFSIFFLFFLYFFFP